MHRVSLQLDMMSEQTPDEFICEYESGSWCGVLCCESVGRHCGDSGSVAVLQGVRTVASTTTRSVQSWDHW